MGVQGRISNRKVCLLMIKLKTVVSTQKTRRNLKHIYLNISYMRKRRLKKKTNITRISVYDNIYNYQDKKGQKERKRNFVG